MTFDLALEWKLVDYAGERYRNKNWRRYKQNEEKEMEEKN